MQAKQAAELPIWENEQELQSSKADAIGTRINVVKIVGAN
jgi:hypothetical protein